MQSNTYDVVVLGAGIVGLATALVLMERHPGLRMAILEKEAEVGLHQTGHNSGVIHAGIYYKPGSLKARLCVEGARRMVAFCESHKVPYARCGKVVVATNDTEVAGLEELHRRGTQNGVEGLRKLSAEALLDLEPCARGVAGLHSPNTAIVDYRRVARAMAEDVRARGVDILTGSAVTRVVSDGGDHVVQTTTGDVRAHALINCAGLHADILARGMGVEPGLRIIPFRGEYYYLGGEWETRVRGLIYPVPDPELPFLGVHITRTIDGRIEAGPNAVLAFAREGYTRRAVNGPELAHMIMYPGLWRLTRRYWRTGLEEFHRSFRKVVFARSLQHLMPAVKVDDLMPGGAGVRAQAVGRDGRLLDDFVIAESPRVIHVLNAPSPAATASLSIGQYIASLADSSFDLSRSDVPPSASG